MCFLIKFVGILVNNFISFFFAKIFNLNKFLKFQIKHPVYIIYFSVQRLEKKSCIKKNCIQGVFVRLYKLS